MTLLYNAATFDTLDTAHPETAKQAFRIAVPNPATQLLFGERIKQGSGSVDRAIHETSAGTRTDETDVIDFGYPGISMQTDEAYFVHIKKKSVHQSLDSVTFQTHKDWTQYSSHHMYLSSKRKMYLASNRDMVIATDTAMGASPVSNAGAELDHVEFDEHPTDRLRNKLDNAMKVVSPEDELKHKTWLERQIATAAAVISAVDTVLDAIESVRETLLAAVNPEFSLFLWQNKDAKAVEAMIKVSKTALSFDFATADTAPSHIHFAGRAGSGATSTAFLKAGGFSGSIKAIGKTLMAMDSVCEQFLADPLQTLEGAWGAFADAYPDLLGRGDYSQVGKAIGNIISDLTDLIEDLQYLAGDLSLGPEKKPPMQIMSSGQLTIDSMRDLDSFAADGYYFRSNRGGFGVRVRGQADLMGQARAEVFSCGPTSIQGYQSVELLSAGPISILSQKNAIEMVGRKIYVGAVKAADTVRHALTAAVSKTTFDVDKRRTTQGTGTTPSQKVDEYDSFTGLQAPTENSCTSPYDPSNLQEHGSHAGSQASSMTNPPQGRDAPPIDLKSTFVDDYHTTDYVQVASNVEQLLAVGHADTLKWKNGNSTSAVATSADDPHEHAKAHIRLRKDNGDSKAAVEIEAKGPGLVRLRVGGFEVMIDQEKATIGKYDAEKPHVLITADKIELVKTDNTKIVLSDKIVMSGGSSSVKMEMTGSKTTFYGKTYLGN